MTALHWRDGIIRATKAGNTARIDQLAVQLSESEEIKRLRQALSHRSECVVSSTPYAPETTKPATSQ